MSESDLKYMAIYRELRRRLTEGRYEVGALFPTEPELQREFGASRITVRRSVQMLADEGYVRRMQGIGTVVLSTKGSLQLQSLASFASENQGRELSSKVLRYETSELPAPIVRYRLGLAPGDSVACQERVRYVDGIPIGLQRVYVPAFVGLDECELRSPEGSLYAVLEERGHKVSEAEETIAAVAADEELSGHLGISPGSPLLYVQRTTRDQNACAVEYAEIYYRGDSYQYTAQLRSV